MRIDLINWTNELQKLKNSQITELVVRKFLLKTAHFAFVQNDRDIYKKWITIIDKEFDELYRTDRDISIENLEEKSLKTTDLLEIEIFNHFYKKEKLILLFDGFDEICPDYTKIVIKFLQILKESTVQKIWITTRPYIQNDLQDELKVSPHSLIPLDQLQQIDLIQKLWQKSFEIEELDNNRLNLLVTIFLENITVATNSYSFMGIPLHVIMIAEFCRKDFEEIYKSERWPLSQEPQLDLNLVTIYKKILRAKYFDIVNEEKRGIKNVDPLIKVRSEQDYERIIKDHERLALRILFNEKIDNIEPNFISQSLGIIDRDNDGKLRFIHQTFAEYLAARYFWKQFKIIEVDKFEKCFVKDVMIDKILITGKLQILEFLKQKAKHHKKPILNIYCKIQMLLKHYFLNDVRCELLVFIETLIQTIDNVDVKLILRVVDTLDQINLYNMLLDCSKIASNCFTKAVLEKISSEFLKNRLQSSFFDSNPLYIAAYNENMNIVSDILQKISHDKKWLRNKLIPILCETKAINIIAICLKMNMIDSEFYEKILIQAIKEKTPDDLIRELLEKANIEELTSACNFDELLLHLFHHDKDITALFIEKGLDISIGMSKVFKVYMNPITVTEPKVSARLKNNEYAYFSSDRFYIRELHVGFSDFYNRIECILKAGAGYNFYFTDGSSPVQYAGQVHYVRKIFELMKEKKYDSLNMILRIIIYCCAEYKSHDCSPDGTYILSKSFNFEHDKIFLFPKYFRCIYKTFSSNLDASNFSKQIKLLLNILQENLRSPLSETPYTQELYYTKSFRDLLNRVNYLSVKCGYRLDKAYKQVETEVWSYVEIVEKYSKLKTNKENNSISVEEMLDILNIKHISIDEELKNLILEISENNYIEILLLVWTSFIDKVNYGEVLLALEYYCKRFEEFSKLFELFQKLDKNFIELIDDIKNEIDLDIEKVSSQIDPVFVRAVINGRDIKYGSPLHYAAFKGNVKITEFLLKHGANANILLKSNHDLLLSCDKGSHNAKHAYTPLHVAVTNNKHEIVQILLKEGAMVNVTFGKSTSLHIAARKGYTKVVDILLSNKANANSIDENHLTAMHYAAQNGHIEIIQLLIEKGANIIFFDNYGKSPLCYAVDCDQNEIVRLLLNLVDKNYDKFLSKAAKRGREKIVELLLKDRITNIGPINEKNYTYLHYAAMAGHLKLAQTLVEKGAPVDAINRKKETPLHLAARYNRWKIVKFLLNNDANINSRNINNWSPIHCAINEGHINIINYFLRKKADVDICNTQVTLVSRLFQHAIINKRRKVVKFLLRHIINDNYKIILHKNYYALLERKCRYRISFDEKVLFQFFLKDNTDYEKEYSVSLNLSHYAIAVNKLAIAKTLLKKHRDVNARISTSGDTLLHIAVKLNNNNFTKILISNNAQYDIKNNKNQTPFDTRALVESKTGKLLKCIDNLYIEATNTGSREKMLSLLDDRDLDTKICLNARSLGNNTLLHCACKNGHLKIVELLLEKNVVHNVKNDEGKTALDLTKDILIEEPENCIQQQIEDYFKSI